VSSLGVPGALLGSLGLSWGSLWGSLGVSQAVYGVSWGLLGLFWGSTGALLGFFWGSLGLSRASATEVAATTAVTAAAVADSGLHYLWALYMGMGWGGTYDHHFHHCFF
jgi:hypothetical protein